MINSRIRIKTGAGKMKSRLIRLGILSGFTLLMTNTASGSETATYSYDALGRLVSSSTSGTVNNGLSVTATFDPAGNRSNYAVSGAASAPTIITPTTYSSSSTYGGYTGLSGAGAGMRDAIYNVGTSVHGTNNGADEWIVMDLGSAKSVGKAVLVPINSSFGGWGPLYLNTAVLERSTDGSSWTSVATISTAGNDVKTEITVGASARYLRVRKSGWLGVGDFYALTP